LAEDPVAGVGETGLDRWILGLKPELRALWHPDLAGFEPPGMDEQREVFRQHIGIAARWSRPLSIHCLQAWAPLLEDLRDGPLPKPGFLVHSYGGPVELVPPLVELGAYFGFPGYFLQSRKERRRETFRHIPEERLLAETDAPDQPLPLERRTHVHQGTDGREWNVPANLGAVVAGLAEVRGTSQERLAEVLESNFHRLFGKPAA
jgi:TatD DNase family protein